MDLDINNNAAYLEFINYANENIQQARQSFIQFNDNMNFLELKKEQLELLLSMFNQLILHIDENNENFLPILTYLRNIQTLLNQYIEHLSQLGNENFVNINLFISKKMSKVGK